MLGIKTDAITSDTSRNPNSVENDHIVTDDWSSNWDGNVAIKITALVVWITVAYSFVIAVTMFNKTTANLKEKIVSQAEYATYKLAAKNYHTVTESNLYQFNKIILEQGFVAAKVSDGKSTKWIGDELSNTEIKQLSSITKFLPTKNNKAPAITIEFFHTPFHTLTQHKMIRTLVIIVLSILGFGFMHVYIISRVLKLPFKALEVASQAVINGDLTIRMSANRQDEFGRIANFFNNMLDRVQQDKNEIDKINSNLEDIVNERTRELKNTNNELKETLDHLQETQKQLMKSEQASEAANEAKSLFLANMSHEIRTPMNAILGYTQILQRDRTLNEDQQTSINAVNRSGNHLLELINDILDITKIEAGQMELHPVDFNLNQLIMDISSMFSLRCEAKHLHWQVNIDSESDTISVSGDEGKLRQVLINLLSNAVKFTNKGGVTLGVKELNDNRFFFETTDTGPGISKSGQKTIFDTFHQDKQGIKKGGTGLGLAISKKQIELMNGNLKVESSPAMGARFYFILPLEKASRPVHQTISQQHTGRLANEMHIKALVVDDIIENREVLSKMLSEMGVDTKQAEDGSSSIMISKKFKPNIIFMDYNMPGINGVEAISSIREHIGNSFKAIIVTAHAFDQDTKKFRAENVDDVISKPCTIEDITSCLVKHLNAKFDIDEGNISDNTEMIMQNDTTTGIPQDLILKLKEAVEYSIITDIENISKQIGAANKKFMPFANLIDKYINEFDMPSIRKLVDSL